jgi:DNA helicase-2/ATP-dependent DNA helicase PcrA
LLTLHAAKGLEFPAVFIVGLNEGILPHSRSFDDPEAMMEERRLMYVGITRAMDRLYLVFSQNRRAYGFTEPVDPSRFLSDIPYQLLEEINPSNANRYARSQLENHPERWQVSNTSNLKIEDVQQRFHPGMRVLHPSWGEGMVLNSRLQDRDEIVDIFFEKLGLKKVVASLANLEIK